jgi:hypothetical protein
MTTCPRCREPLAARQEYCLECGLRVAGGASGPRGWGSSWIRRSAVAGAVALAAAIGAIAATGSDSGGAAVETAIGGFAQTPTPASGEAPESPSGGAEWPVGQDGWTIALASLPQTGGRAPALARARSARAKRLTSVGVLDSSRYASLHPGYWIVFSGVYASEAEATSALEEARRFARAASVRHVVP